MKDGLRFAAAVLAVVLAAGLLVYAAASGPKCAEYRTHWVSGTHIVNGKPVPYFGSESYCARYEEGSK